LILVSCSKEKKIKEPIQIQKKEITKKIDNSPEIISIDTVGNESIEKQYLFLKNGKDSIFYVQNTKSKKMGLIHNNEFVLASKYDKIYSPNITVNGYIEIKKNGKYGLFDYKNNKTIDCRYEVIFPTVSSQAIAIAKVKESYVYLNSNGDETVITDKSKIPNYKHILKDYSFDVFSKDIIKLIDVRIIHYENDAIEGNGVVVTPSYIERLGIIPVIHKNLALNKKENFGIIESDFKVISTAEGKNGVLSFLAKFIEEGIDARGYHKDVYYIGTVEKEKLTTERKLLGEEYAYSSFYYCSDYHVEMINDSIYEYKYMDDQRLYPKYDHISRYNFYKIEEDGNISSLKSNRFFDFTKFVVIDESYFEGCFGSMRENFDYDKDKWNLAFSKHLDIEDLDIMRNEIFAEYGYIFKSKKWKNYFSNKPWYKPKFENVDDFLTEIDKANIDLILKVKEILLKTPDTYAKTKIMHSVAG